MWMGRTNIITRYRQEACGWGQYNGDGERTGWGWKQNILT